MRPVLLLLFAALGIGLGGAAGLALRPQPAVPAAETAADPAAEAPPPAQPGESDSEFTRLGNQFIVPLVEGGQVSGLVVLTLSLEVAPGLGESVFAHEPRLRDMFLRTLFEHANAGGFAGNFTRPTAMTGLRTALREAARGVLGSGVRDVLILDVLRQDS